jgi:hypothetical protein
MTFDHDAAERRACKEYQKSQPQRRPVQQNSPTAALESFWFITAIRFLVAAVATAAAFWLLAFVHGFWA